MEYNIYAALREEISSGWVWLKTPVLPSRSIIKIKNLRNSKEIYCEALSIDENFLSYYNQKKRNN